MARKRGVELEIEDAVTALPKLGDANVNTGEDRFLVYCDDALSRLRKLPSDSVHAVVTSPPYFNLRDYEADGQLGHEATPEEYVAALVAVFREVRRVLRWDGTLWVNIGDSYSRDAKKGGSGPGGKNAAYSDSYTKASKRKKKALVVPPKNLFGIPWRMAFALQADGWVLRSEVIWAKENPMPESVRDRPTKSHEQLFLLAKGDSYYYDHEAVKEPANPNDHGGVSGSQGAFGGKFSAVDGGRMNRCFRAVRSTRNRRDVWEHPDAFAVLEWLEQNRPEVIKEYVAACGQSDAWWVASQPFPGAHFATFPPELIEPCVAASTSERGACPACGAPWERVVARRADVGRVACEPGILVAVSEGDPDEVVTAGWRPVCGCYDAEYSRDFRRARTSRRRRQQDASGSWWTRVRKRPGRTWWTVMRCVVLDPFSGAGTTGVVAVRSGRFYVGIELSSVYAKMSSDRLDKAWRAADQPLLAVVEAKKPPSLQKGLF